MAPRALSDELDLALLDHLCACRVLWRLGKGLVAARRGLWNFAAAELTPLSRGFRLLSSLRLSLDKVRP